MKKRLIDLDPEWVYDYEPVHHSHRRSDTLSIANAQGILFDCPLCGRHSVLAWFKDRGVPDDAEPGPGRWTPTGSGFNDLTLMPSINLDVKPDSPCKWHGWVKNGEVE